MNDGTVGRKQFVRPYKTIDGKFPHFEAFRRETDSFLAGVSLRGDLTQDHIVKLGRGKDKRWAKLMLA